MVKRLALVTVLLLAACQTPQVLDFCYRNDPIRLSETEIDVISPDRLRQILAYNERGEKLCGWKP